jgi:hypothetical protein
MTSALSATIDRGCAGHSSSPATCAVLRAFVQSRFRLQVEIRGLGAAYECGPALDIWLAVWALERPARQLMASLDNLRACVPPYDWRCRAALYEAAALREWIGILFTRCRADHGSETGHCRLCDFIDRQHEFIGMLMLIRPHDASHAHAI